MKAFHINKDSEISKILHACKSLTTTRSISVPELVKSVWYKADRGWILATDAKSLLIVHLADWTEKLGDKDGSLDICGNYIIFDEKEIPYPQIAKPFDNFVGSFFAFFNTKIAALPDHVGGVILADKGIAINSKQLGLLNKIGCFIDMVVVNEDPTKPVRFEGGGNGWNLWYIVQPFVTKEKIEWTRYTNMTNGGEKE